MTGPERHLGWRTRLMSLETHAPAGFRSLTTAVHRGSTTLFDDAQSVRDDWRPDRAPYAYGLHGTPTTFELAGRIADLDGARHTLITPGGQAAIALIYFAFASAGDHVLTPRNAYGPNLALAHGLLARLGIEVELYDPLIGGGVERLIRPNTRLIWCESPGSVTMEVQDVPAIAAAAHRAGVIVALDNTYAAGVLFDAFAHGVDVSMQALTKYVGGHSDLLLGSVSTRDEPCYEALGRARELLGHAVSPDDCSLALRGLQTLGVRLAHLETATLSVARWLAARADIARVLHPALASCPGHDLWRRDFTGSSSLFSIVFADRYDRAAVHGFVNRLRLFKIGYSWGGVTSLATPGQEMPRDYPGWLVRVNIGLEDVDDLIADLDQSLAALGQGSAQG